MKISIIGATGDMGYGLALRLAKAGHPVVIGSRSAERAQEAAQRAREESGCDNITGMDNPAAAAAGELVVLSVPSAGHRATLEGLSEILRNKPVLDITIPMAFKPLRYAPPAEGSNALETKAVLGEECRVACGFHTVSATLLADLSRPLSGDVLILGNDAELVQTVMGLAQQIGLRPVNAGGLQFSPTVEGLTPMLIGVNKRYGLNHAGINITGI